MKSELRINDDVGRKDFGREKKKTKNVRNNLNKVEGNKPKVKSYHIYGFI